MPFHETSVLYWESRIGHLIGCACECVVFEDAQAGVEAALAGGMYIIGVGNKTTLNRANHTIEGFQNVGMEIFEKL